MLLIKDLTFIAPFFFFFNDDLLYVVCLTYYVTRHFRTMCTGPADDFCKPKCPAGTIKTFHSRPLETPIAE